jgi:Protein of unknown function (DUF1571)
MNDSKSATSTTPPPLGNYASAAENVAPRPGRPWLAIGLLFLVIVALISVAAYLFSDSGLRRGSNASGAGIMLGPNNDPAAMAKQPLAPALDLARKVLKNIQDNVHDYTATVIKQERISGKLTEPEVCQVKMRRKPFSVYMDFLEPPGLKGQEVIYVDGANDSNIVAHGSGLKALVGTVKIPPGGPLAMAGQRYPITELGIENLTRRLIEVGTNDQHYGETYVWENDDAKVGDRPCISFTVLHPVKRSKFIFHIARIFVDKELLVPLHYEAYDWPEKPGDPPPLLERYTYANLKLNPGLTDADFDPSNPEYRFVTK